MSEVIHGEVLFFGVSVLTGVLIFAGYDLLRALRCVFPGHKGVLGALDFCYWCTAGIVAFGMILFKNSGILRGFSIIGMLLGMIIYYKSLSRLAVRVLSGLLQLISTAIKKILHFLLIPGRFFLKKYRKITLKTLKKKLKRVKINFNKH